jgi:mRNA interferase MazF
VQGDGLNFSRIATIVCVPITSNLRWAGAPGNTLLRARMSGLPKDSVANATQIIALDRGLLTERAGKVARRQLNDVLAGIDVVLGRSGYPIPSNSKRMIASLRRASSTTRGAGANRCLHHTSIGFSQPR